MRNIIKHILTEETENFRIMKTTNDDIDDIYSFLVSMFPDIPEDVLYDEISNVNYNISLIAKSDNIIVGCLLLSNESICDYIKSTEVVKINDSPNLYTLCNQRGLKGVVFAIHPEFRGTTLNVRFLKLVRDVIREYDYVYGLVYSFLKTHNYWKRFGMSNYGTVIDDGEVVEVYVM
jgi:hypothetical protein